MHRGFPLCIFCPFLTILNIYILYREQSKQLILETVILIGGRIKVV
jgi:hypothetical protein